MTSLFKTGATAFVALALIAVACQDDTKSKNNGSSSASSGTTSSGTTSSGQGGDGATNTTGSTSSSGTGGQGPKETDCSNMKDDDGDTFVDCDDFDCEGTADCPNPTENTDALCSDKMDNDEDKLVDCEDDSCHGHPCAVRAAGNEDRGSNIESSQQIDEFGQAGNIAHFA